MEMNSERVAHTHFQQTGEEWIRAIAEGSLERLENLCHPGVTSQLLTHKRHFNYDTAEDLVTKIHQWFGACSDFQVEHSRVEMVGERLGIFYRFRLLEEGIQCIVEQQVYCTLVDDRIAQLQLLCSGFQQVPAGAQVDPEPESDALLELQTGASQTASTCALLTPAIKTKLREMQSGQVLEVRVDDLSARGDIEAWCRLSGNQLVMMREGPGPELRFYVKKK